MLITIAAVVCIIGVYLATKQPRQKVDSKATPLESAEEANKQNRDVVISKLVELMTDKSRSADANREKVKVLIAKLLDQHDIAKTAEILDSIILAEQFHIKIFEVISVEADGDANAMQIWLNSSLRVRAEHLPYEHQKNLSRALSLMCKPNTTPQSPSPTKPRL